jgi:hypothetical protein
MTTNTKTKWLLNIWPVHEGIQPDWHNPISEHSFWDEDEAYKFANQHNEKNFYGPINREGRSYAQVYGYEEVEQV